MVVPLGRDVYVFGRHFDGSNADGSDGRGGLLSLTVWCGHHFRWVDGHDYVLKRVACHLAQPANGDCVDKSSRAEWSGLAHYRSRGAARGARIEDKHGVFHTYALLHERRKSLSRTDRSINVPHYFLNYRLDHYQHGKIQRF